MDETLKIKIEVDDRALRNVSKDVKGLGSEINSTTGDTHSLTQGFEALGSEMRLLNSIGLGGLASSITRLKIDISKACKSCANMKNLYKDLQQTKPIAPFAAGAFADIQDKYSGLTLLKKELSAIGNHLKYNSKQWGIWKDEVKKYIKNGILPYLNDIWTTIVKIAKVALPLLFVGFAKKGVEMASKLQEVQNVVDVSFGAMSADVEKFAKQTMYWFGLSELSAKEYASNFMAMSNGMGIDKNLGKEMSLNLTALTGDLSSFFNVKQDVANTALKSVFTGETESLKKFGVVLTDANLKQFAFANGIRKSYSNMNQAEKVALRYAYVMNSLKNAQWDFSRTANSYTNQLRLMKEQFSQLSSAIGQALLPALTLILKVINAILKGILAVVSAFGKLVGKDLQIASSTVGDNISGGMDDAYGTAKKLKRELMGFDELNVLSAPDEGGASVDTGLGSGIGADLTSLIEGSGYLDDLTTKTATWYEKLLGIAAILGTIALISQNKVIGSIIGILAACDLVRNSIDAWKNGLSGKNLLGMLSDILVMTIALGAAFGPVGAAIALLVGGIALLIAGFHEWFKTGKLSSESSIAIGLGFMAIGAAISLLTGSWIPLLIGAVAGLVVMIAGNADWCREKLQSLDDWLTGVFTTDWTTVFGPTLGNILNGFSKIFGDIWKDVKYTLNGVIDFIEGVFTGDWEKIWTGLGEIVAGIFVGLWDLVKGGLNLVIIGINAMIDAVAEAINWVIGSINKVKFDVPDWVPAIGGKSFAPNIKEISNWFTIPLLADGGVLSTPTIAEMGEYAGAKNNPEIVSPQSLMYETVANANEGIINAVMTAGQMMVEAVNNKDTDIKLDGMSLARNMSKSNQRYTNLAGQSLVIR